jgi:hypothetical protein
MLARSNGTRKLMNNYNSNGGITINNASSVNIDSEINESNPALDAFTLLNLILKGIDMQTLKSSQVIDKDDQQLLIMLKEGEVTNARNLSKYESYIKSVLNRITLIPDIKHAGSFLNKLRQSNKYKLTQKKVIKIKLREYDNQGHSGTTIGVIDKDSENFVNLSGGEEKILNYLYMQKVAGSTSANDIPASKVIERMTLQGGRRRRSRKALKKSKKATKKTSRRRRTTRKH